MCFFGVGGGCWLFFLGSSKQSGIGIFSKMVGMVSVFQRWFQVNCLIQIKAALFEVAKGGLCCSMSFLVCQVLDFKVLIPHLKPAKIHPFVFSKWCFLCVLWGWNRTEICAQKQGWAANLAGWFICVVHSVSEMLV